MSNPTPSPAPQPLNFTKHAVIIALLAAAGQFIASLVTQGAIAPPVGAGIGALIGEALIYEHSA
jgi:hypothetical protein